MKKFLQIIFIAFISSTINLSVGAQQNNAKTKKKDWIERMQDPDVDFKQLQKDFNEYWKDRTDYKGNGYKIFKRWEYINEFRILPDGKKQKPDYVFKTYEKYKKSHPNLKSASGAWSIVAPIAYPINNTSQPTGMGRINAIAFDPTDATGNTIFIGSPSGGFWKTTDHGGTWTDLSANMPTLGVSSILIHPTDPDIIYLGSGDRDSDDAPGMGVFKSTNSGDTWTQININSGEMDDACVNAMVMHPSDPNIIIAATSKGIFRTTDGGSTWSYKLGPGNFKDMKLKPGDSDIVYAVLGTYLYRSSNGGDNWTNITSGVPSAGSRMVIGVTPAEPTHVYLVQIDPVDKTFEALLKSDDSGLNFSTRSTSPNLFGYACDGLDDASQATYDLCVTVDPINADNIFVGGVNNWKSADNGVNWTISTHWAGSCGTALHADQHCYEWNNNKLYVGHDGGISYTDDGGTTWTEITNNLPITQIYKMGQSAINNNTLLYGQQDNGSNALVGSSLVTTRGGDGGECLVDFTDENYCYNTYINGKISRSTVGPTGSYSSIIEVGENGIGSDESGAWITPYFLHKNDASTMFVGYENVYRTSNVKTGTVIWEAISTGETSTCRVIEQSPANNDILYVVRSGNLQRTDNANETAGSVGWTACTLPGGSGTPTDIKAHYSDEDIVYATAGYKVYKSTDKGANWTDISGTLPSLFINCLVIDKTANEGIYVGNQTGVYYKNASMSDWVEFSDDLPKVDIRELEIFYDPVGTAHRIKAATYGRGLWESDLYDETRVSNPTNFSAEVVSNTQVDLSWTLNGQNNNVLLAYSTTPNIGTPVNGTTYPVSSAIPGGGEVLYSGNNTAFNHTMPIPETSYYYKLWSYDGSHTYSAGTNAAAYYLFPYSEGFENGLGLWTQDASDDFDWTRQTGPTPSTSYNTGPSSASEGNYYMFIETSTPRVEGDYAMLVSPRFVLNGYSGAEFDFYYHMCGSSMGSLYLEVSEDNGSNWITEWSKSGQQPLTTVTTDPYLKATVNLDSYVNKTILLRFRGVRGSSYTGDAAIDDITFRTTSNISTWNGNTSTDWNTASNWSHGAVPATDIDVIIPAGFTNYPVLTGNYTIKNIEIRDGALVTINSGATFTVTGELKNLATFGIKILSDATGTGSLQAGSVSGTGTAEIQRYMTANQWHMVAAPVAQSIASFLSDNNNIPTSGSYRGMMDYNTTGNTWNTFFTNAKEGNLEIGKGYSIRVSSDGIITFKGTMHAGSKDVSVVDNGAAWNLIGNPFTTAINTNNGASSFISSNAANFASSYQSLYFWDEDASTTEYQLINLSDDADVATLTQAFFVKAASDINMSFTPSMQLHSTNVDLKKANLKSEVKLFATSSNKKVSTKFKFMDGATEGLDPGYDAGLFKRSSMLSIYSKLVWDNGVDFALQCLPPVKYFNDALPIGIENSAGGDVSFSAESNGIPSGYKIILADKLHNHLETFKKPEQIYTTVVDENEDRFGRFYLFVARNINKRDIFNVGQEEDNISESINRINTYLIEDEIIIEGKMENNANARLFDMQGRAVLIRNLQPGNVNKMQVKNLKTGIYILQINNNGVQTGIKIPINK